MIVGRSDSSKLAVPFSMVVTVMVVLSVFMKPQTLFGADSPRREKSPKITEVYKIWDFAPHNAFTDLIRFRGRWFCTFREGERHVYGKDGTIRIISSKDGKKWESYALLEEKGIDLRDPKLSITPDGRLMLSVGGSVYRDKELLNRRPRVSFSADGKNWTGFIPVLKDGEWLWRVTWHKGVAWGTSYSNLTPDWNLSLYKSEDGINYQLVTQFQIDGRPNETTLRFLSDGDMLALVRRESGNKKAMIGRSKSPYTGWSWKETGFQVGGPNFIVIGKDEVWAAGRSYGEGYKTTLARMNSEEYQPVLDLPGGGDTSYPGMVWYKNSLWMSYYSSHEGKASIYLAKIKL